MKVGSLSHTDLDENLAKTFFYWGKEEKSAKKCCVGNVSVYTLEYEYKIKSTVGTVFLFTIYFYIMYWLNYSSCLSECRITFLYTLHMPAISNQQIFIYNNSFTSLLRRKFWTHLFHQ